MSSDSHLRQWAESTHSRNYLGIADLMIRGRERSLMILRSFYRHFLEDTAPNTLLDLGCGDGVVAYELLQLDPSIIPTLLDGSAEMIGQARKKLADYENCTFITATFQDLLAEEIEIPSFNLVASSFAIHHLTSSERKSLFEYLLDHLNPGGCFVNIDMVRSSSEKVEGWYLELWKQFVSEQNPSPEMRNVFEEMFNRYTEKEHYRKIDPIEKQMAALESVGFRDVDCFFKDGIFAMYGGGKPD
ncbi:MAG: methyltransferase domain-containing protein [Dehalococcoidia bacterium]